MSPLRSPETDPPRPTLRERGEVLKAGIARAVGRRPAAAAADPALPEPAIDFVPVVVATPVRTPREWQDRLAPHLLAVHMADKLIRMDRAGVAAFIRDAGEHDEDMPVAMLDNLGLAAAQFTALGELTTAAHARFYVAAGDAIGETAPPAPEPSAPEPVAAPPEPSAVFERIAATTRKAAADALADDRVSPALRMVIEAHRDTTLAMLLCPDDSNEASEPLCEAVEASGEALRAVPARSIADVRAKLAFLLPEILPDVNGATPTAFLENVFDDVERLVRDTGTPTDPRLSPDRAWAVAQAADVNLSGLSILELNNLFERFSGIAGQWLAAETLHMDMKDIPEMIASRDQHEIERAYRALVGFPTDEEIEGATAPGMLSALDAVSIALRQDFDVMPRLTCEAARLPGGSTYADGANDFAGNRAWWEGHLASLFGGH